MKFNPYQSDFSGGEISKRAQGRFDTDMYRTALYRAANMLPVPQGSIASRAGAKYVARPVLYGDAWGDANISAGTVPAPSVLFQDAYGGSQQIPIPNGPYGPMVLDIQNGYARFMNRSGVLTFNKPFLDWESALGPFGYKIGGVNPVTLADFQTIYFDPTDNSIELYNDGTKPELMLTGDLPSNPGDPFNYVPWYGFPAGTNEEFYFSFTHSGTPVTVEIVSFDGVTIGANTYFAATVFTAGRHVITFTPRLAGVSKGFQIRIKSAATTVAAVKLQDFNLTKNKQQQMETIGFVGNGNTRAVSFYTNNNQDFWIVLCGNSRNSVYAFHWQALTGGSVDWTSNLSPKWRFGTLQSFCKAGTPSLSATALAVYQNRLWLGDSFGNIITSKVGFGSDPGTGWVFDFTTPSVPPKAAESLVLQLAQGSGGIAWMNILRGMLLGTTQREIGFGMNASLALDPAAGLVFSATDESFHGSSLWPPAVNINDKVVFAPTNGQMLRSVGYRFETAGLLSEDLTAAAEHLFRSRIVSMAYAKTPTPRLVVVLTDGTAAVGTLGTSKVGPISWARLTVPTKFGGLTAVSVLELSDNKALGINATQLRAPVNGHSEVWLGTRSGHVLLIRNLDSDPGYTPARVGDYNMFGASPIPDGFKDIRLAHGLYDPPVMDGWMRAPIQNVAGVQSILDLPGEYIGQSVDVMHSSGVYLGSYVVAAQVPVIVTAYGKVTFPVPLGLTNTFVDPAGKLRPAFVFVGIRYNEHKFKTLPFEGGNPAGTSQGQKARRVKTWLRLNNSDLPMLNGHRDFGRIPNSLFLEANLGSSLITGDVEYTKLGWSRGEQIEISQDRPLRIEVSAIHGTIQGNET